MIPLEKSFQEEFIKRCNTAQEEYGCKSTRLLQNIEKFGSVRTVQEIIRKGRISDNFHKLQQAGRIDLTMEALVAESKYGELFTDDEVNSCYNLLCEYGYYK